MGFFEDRPWLRNRTLSEQQVAYLRDVLTVHRNDPEGGGCRICRTVSCPDWRAAYDELAAAGALMAEPEQWLATARPGARGQ